MTLAASLRADLVAIAAATALTMSGCGGISGEPNPSSSPASQSQNQVTNVCAAIERTDITLITTVLGAAPTGHLACEASKHTSTLGAAVWTAANGRRVSVGVIDNEAAKANIGQTGIGIGDFDSLYNQAPQNQRDEFVIPGSTIPKRCLNQTQLPESSLTVDMGKTYVSVWVSQETGSPTASLIRDRDQFTKLVTNTITNLYSH